MKWLKSIFSEEDGKGSFSRVSTFVLVVSAVCWVTHLVHHNNALPDFTGLSIFIATLYGVNTVRNALPKSPSPQPPPSPSPPPPPNP